MGDFFRAVQDFFNFFFIFKLLQLELNNLTQDHKILDMVNASPFRAGRNNSLQLVSRIPLEPVWDVLSGFCVLGSGLGTGHIGEQRGLSPFPPGIYRQVNIQLLHDNTCSDRGSSPVPLSEKMYRECTVRMFF